MFRSNERKMLVNDALPTLFNVPNPPPKLTSSRRLSVRNQCVKARTMRQGQGQGGETSLLIEPSQGDETSLVTETSLVIETSQSDETSLGTETSLVTKTSQGDETYLVGLTSPIDIDTTTSLKKVTPAMYE